MAGYGLGFDELIGEAGEQNVHQIVLRHQRGGEGGHGEQLDAQQAQQGPRLPVPMTAPLEGLCVIVLEGVQTMIGANLTNYPGMD